MIQIPVGAVDVFYVLKTPPYLLAWRTTTAEQARRDHAHPALAAAMRATDALTGGTHLANLLGRGWSRQQINDALIGEVEAPETALASLAAARLTPAQHALSLGA